MNEHDEIHICANCEWRSDEFTSVCVNDASDHLADFVEAEGTCECWEETLQSDKRPKMRDE